VKKPRRIGGFAVITRSTSCCAGAAIKHTKASEYGTTTLVSEAVRNRVEHCFRFKAVASVIAKGMTTETQVYELVEAVA